jgi:hypothetical protein
MKPAPVHHDDNHDHAEGPPPRNKRLDFLALARQASKSGISFIKKADADSRVGTPGGSSSISSTPRMSVASGFLSSPRTSGLLVSPRVSFHAVAGDAAAAAGVGEGGRRTPASLWKKGVKAVSAFRRAVSMFMETLMEQGLVEEQEQQQKDVGGGGNGGDGGEDVGTPPVSPRGFGGTPGGALHVDSS